MRIWDIPVGKLCRKHLLGEHNELHAIFNIITQGKKGFANHPEVRRWRGKTLALYMRHACQVFEMEKRRYNHKSPLDLKLVTDSQMMQTEQWQTTEKQRELLRAKGCECNI